MISQITLLTIAIAFTGHVLPPQIDLQSLQPEYSIRVMQPLSGFHFIPSDPGSLNIPRLTRKRLKILEDTKLVGPIEKVRLLAILCSKRWLTELEQSPSKDVIGLIDSLGLSWSKDGYTKQDGTRVNWISVGTNKAVIEYLTKYRDRLSLIEAGILYGYPPTAILSCTSLIPVKVRPTRRKGAMVRCLGGLHSAKFITVERRYLQSIWSDLRKVSMRIISEAEKFHDMRRNESKMA